MLVLCRRQGEEIVIGDNVVITLVTSSDGRARIGITAPPELPVMRRELYEARMRVEAEGAD